MTARRAAPSTRSCYFTKHREDRVNPRRCHSELAGELARGAPRQPPLIELVDHPFGEGMLGPGQRRGDVTLYDLPGGFSGQTSSVVAIASRATPMTPRGSQQPPAAQTAGALGELQCRVLVDCGSDGGAEVGGRQDQQLGQQQQRRRRADIHSLFEPCVVLGHRPGR